ncbi:metallophosphoesterase family protein [Cytophagales bacterium LB-30]|uniref:Phosphoesterase n=1 Tax=Shiella aurantiaca TaxID=3058365 RepID=A0ABT8F226_9BACT|nr:metallophosphoesterase family protein [Shiella aurantiaca]MDN4164404.1 metallophosphoesterase family protein [Shiella aurantiaca]
MRIGLLSDTHSYIDERILHHLSGCDEIWHAGDVGNLSVIESLQALKPLVGVYGNIDDPTVRGIFPEKQVFEREGVRILMLHIAGAPPKYNPVARQLLKEHKPDLLVCGHSHILRVVSDKDNQVLYMNPGAAGKHGFHKVRTLLTFHLHQGKVEQAQVVELGKRT